MKKLVFGIGAFLVLVIIAVTVVLFTDNQTKTLSCTVGVGSFTQTIIYEYDKENIISINDTGRYLVDEAVDVYQETYIETYNTANLFDLFELYITDKEPEGYICTYK